MFGRGGLCERPRCLSSSSRSNSSSIGYRRRSILGLFSTSGSSCLRRRPCSRQKGKIRCRGQWLILQFFGPHSIPVLTSCLILSSESVGRHTFRCKIGRNTGLAAMKITITFATGGLVGSGAADFGIFRVLSKAFTDSRAL